MPEYENEFLQKPDLVVISAIKSIQYYFVMYLCIFL